MVDALRALVAAGLVALAGCDGAAEVTEPARLHERAYATLRDPMTPIEAPRDLDGRRVALGKRLFVDPILSADGKVACVDCHLFDRGGADGVTRPKLAARAEGVVNSTSIFNLAYLYRYNWSAKFDDLGEQLAANMKNKLTMRSSLADAAARLASTPYRDDFAAAFPDGLTAANVRDAIVAYELSLVTPNAPFDRYLRGDASALSADQRDGYRLFKSYGCVSCHQGAAIGGNMMQRFGVMGDYFADRGDVKEADYGYYAVTHDERDRFTFRVPSLRNVALTAPYFHDGSAATLDEAVDVMATYQLGRTLESGDEAKIVAFLGALTGELPEDPRGER